MGVSERKAREKQALRTEILEAARELFAAEGYKRVSMRRIAQKIEYSPTTIYLYFKDKAELLHALCEETFRGLSGRIERVIEKVEDPAEALFAGLREYVLFGLEHPNHYRVSFMEPSDLAENPEVYLQPGSFALKAYDFLRRGVAAGVAAGVLRPVDIDVASQALWCIGHGLTSNMIASPAFPWADREKLIGLTLGAAIDGLRA